MTLKGDAKFIEKMTCGFRYDMRNFNPTTQKSENFFSMGSFCPMYIRFKAKNAEELLFMTMNIDAKFE